MSAADRFIDGQDRLAALLKALPAYMPPERLAAAVQAAAHAAQQEADARRAGALPFGLPFSAPPGLASAVLEEAARLQAAQAGRRDAVLASIEAGQPAAQALGAPVSDATRDWLAAQARSTAIAQAAGRTEQTRTTRARRWWRSLGAVASVAAVAGLTTSIVLRQVDEGALQPGAVRESTTPQAATPATAPAPAPTAAPTAGNAPARVQDAPVAAPANPTPPAPKAAPPASRELRQEREATPRQRVQPPAERKATPRGETQAMPAPATEGLLPQAPAVAAAPPMPAYSAMAEAAPAPAPAAAPGADFARKAAPPLAAARAPAALAAAAMVVSVQEDPASVAARMQATPALGLWAAEPDSADIREWVERLWQSMPAGQRPPLPYAVQPDRTLAPGQVRIELQHRAPQ